ncbi:unnamed protein product [Rotaria sordida]|uniref:F-box domain-containing protein n=1 Tax=Rotaria sordida TaxID=392033 RepID=A0A818Y280_9BILA|nr:unnamed protein product [Rotaria sordida]CAF3748494.1 unnamed protein product [Rotaria sordida]
MSSASLYTLPIELVYHIFDNLDVQTIFFSFRNVCKRFYTIVDIYNRYELDLSSVSKSEFHRICRIIRPENVISLILSNNDMTPGQICLFISLFNIKQFVHLRALTLIEIEKFELNLLIEHININSLNALSIKIRKNNSKSNDKSMISLLSNIVMANLHKFDLSMWSQEINNIVWPKQCTLQYLTLGHYVTLKQVCEILRHLSHLRTLVLRNCIVNDTDGTMTSFSDIQTNTHLTSLTLKNSRLQMNELELLLSLTPSLVHLQLTGSVNLLDAILDGARWEEFIQIKLSSLKKFEFFFRTKTDINHNPIDIESWVSPFRTMFWLKHKSWFVTCNFSIKTATLRLYSVPICDPCITYESDFDKIVCTTCTAIENDALIMNNVREVHLDLTLMMASITAQKVCYEKTKPKKFLWFKFISGFLITLRSHHLFLKLTDLTLTINGEWPADSMEFLSNLIDLTNLITLGLYVDFDHCSVSNTINNIGYLLKQTYNVRSLTLSNSHYRSNLNGIVETRSYSSMPMLECLL